MDTRHYSPFFSVGKEPWGVGRFLSNCKSSPSNWLGCKREEIVSALAPAIKMNYITPVDAIKKGSCV